MPGISDPGAELVRACLRAGLAGRRRPRPDRAHRRPRALGSPDRAVRLRRVPAPEGRRSTYSARRARRRSRGRPCSTNRPRRVAATLADLAAVCGPDRPVAVVRELTKLHEEAYRGPLGEAAALAARPTRPRGEHVIVLGGAPTRRGERRHASPTRSATRSSRGASARDAATAVAAELGVARRRAYEVALTQRKS